MEIKSAIAEAIKELIIPELNGMKSDIQGLKSGLEVTNKRLDDQNHHLIEISRRIEATNIRIDQLKDEFIKRTDETKADLIIRIDATNDRIENARSDLTLRLGDLDANLVARIDSNNDRINQLYLAIVRREEHEDLKQLLKNMDARVQKLEKKAAGTVKPAKMEYESV